LALDFIFDNVAPVITVTEEITQGILGRNLTILSGSVTDGGPATYLSVHVYPPEGDPFKSQVIRNGDDWEFDLDLAYLGTYTLWVSAVDLAGNANTAGPFNVNVQPPYQVFLPFVVNDGISGPDLMIANVFVYVNDVEIVIKNIGNQPVVDGFWVDLYINPSPIPTATNQTWDLLSDQGLVWGVEEVSSLEPGGTLILNLQHPSYRPDYSYFDGGFSVSDFIYIQVDSYADTTYGGVLEIDELTGNLYNNIAGPSYPLPISVDNTSSSTIESQSSTSPLPKRSSLVHR
jgi:hypothetical protein